MTTESSAATTANGVPFFKPSPGEPTDSCPLCGIDREHAGNPDACGGGWKKIGCFDPDSCDEAEKMRRLGGWLESKGVVS